MNSFINLLSTHSSYENHLFFSCRPDLRVQTDTLPNFLSSFFFIRNNKEPERRIMHVYINMGGL